MTHKRRKSRPISAALRADLMSRFSALSPDASLTGLTDDPEQARSRD